jgi:hypothetical protein
MRDVDIVSAGSVVVCFGTRPQVIKASALLSALRAKVPTVAIDTGQHYDYELNALLYQQLDIREPDHCLEVGSGSHAVQTASILERIEPLLERLAAARGRCDWRHEQHTRLRAGGGQAAHSGRPRRGRASIRRRHAG